MPDTLMMLLEYTNVGIMVLLAGTLGDTKQLAAMVLLVSIQGLIIMIPLGFGIAGVQMVCNAIGANKL